MFGLDPLNTLLLFWLKPWFLLFLINLALRPTRYRSAQYCHWLQLRLTLLVLLIIPVSLVFTGFFMPLMPNSWHTEPESLAHSKELGAMLVGVYGFVTIFLLARCGLDWLRALRLIKRCRATRLAPELLASNRCGHRTRALESPDLETPVVWGAQRALLLLPIGWALWERERLLRVLRHEYAHIERRDWLSNQVLTVLCAFLWFIPSLWIIRRDLAEQAEIACDDTVLAECDCRVEYATDLLKLSAGHQNRRSFVALTSGRLKRRLDCVLDAARDRSQLAITLRLLGLTLGLLGTLGVSLVHIGYRPAAPTLSRTVLLDIADEQLWLRNLPQPESFSSE